MRNVINKKNRQWLSGVVAFLMISCNQSATLKEAAQYVGDPEHGLTRQAVINNQKITSQFIPNMEANDDTYSFRVYINSKGETVSDSVLYWFNYRSAELFRLIAAGDTLVPVLSERVANGRRDVHEFNLLFAPGKSILQPGSAVHLLVQRNLLVPKDMVFEYKSTDITKASKKLYGYDQN